MPTLLFLQPDHLHVSLLARVLISANKIRYARWIHYWQTPARHQKLVEDVFNCSGEEIFETLGLPDLDDIPLMNREDAEGATQWTHFAEVVLLVR